MPATFSVFFCAPLSVIGIFFGSRSALGDFGNFNASRPLSDSSLARAVVTSLTLSLIFSAVVWATFFALVLVVVGEHWETSKLLRAIQTTSALALTGRMVLFGLAVWSAVGLVTALTLAGRRVVGLALPAVFGVWIAGLLIPLSLRPEVRPAFTWVYAVLWLLICLAAAAGTFIVSWRRRLIFWPSLLLAALLVVICLAAAYGSGWLLDERFRLPLILGCGLIPIPLAAAPLAVYLNRHR